MIGFKAIFIDNHFLVINDIFIGYSGCDIQVKWLEENTKELTMKEEASIKATTDDELEEMPLNYKNITKVMKPGKRIFSQHRTCDALCRHSHLLDKL